jgi:hypothetical protein
LLKDNKGGVQPQAKKKFVIRETPVWLDQHQDWVSDGARQLYKALRTLADQKTGRLFIPGRGWIHLRTVELKAGMSEPTRLKYTKELIALGCYHVHRDRVTRSKDGRERVVLGQAQITVSPLEPSPHKHSRSSTPKPKKPNTGKRSPTPKNDASKEIEPQHSVSSTPKSEETLLHPNSSTLEDVGCLKMSETTTMGGAVGFGSSVGVPPEGVPPEGESIQRSLSQELPAPTPEQKREFFAWMDKIILDRAYDGVRCKVALLTVARRQFQADLPREIEDWLLQPARDFYDRAFYNDPFGEVDRDDCREFLFDTARAKLPYLAQRAVTAQIIVNAEQAIVKERELLVGATGQSCVSPCPEKWQKYKDAREAAKAKPN